MTLRPYQREAVEAVYRHLREHDDNPCVVLPTAAGKTHVISTICRDSVLKWQGRVLILAHVKELLQQAVEKLQLTDAELAPKVGVYSAGLKSRDTEYPIIVAGIQSVYKRACELDTFDLIIVDECHLIPVSGEGMYRQFLKDMAVINPNVRLIGLTATPYRMTTGMICGPDNILNTVCYEVGVRELIVQGYLCPLISKAGIARADTSDLHIRGGEFVAREVEDLMDDDELVRAACREIIEHTRDRNACLIFASGVNHGQHIQRILREEHGQECGFVCGETPTPERDALLARFKGESVPDGLFVTKRDPLKYLCNVNVLTTGFDAPNIDCVALVRPTMSPGLYYQMVGRGFRLHPSKKDCLVLDFGGNILRHGPVDAVRIEDAADRGKGDAPAKECPECHRVIHAAYGRCPECGFVFPPPDRQKHSAQASDEGILSDQVKPETYDVRKIWYNVHVKRNAPEDAPRSMRVDYEVDFRTVFSEWICLEHTGYARDKAEKWWAQRSNAPAPSDTEYAVELAHHGALAEPSRITVRKAQGKDEFDRIIDYELGPISEHREPGWDAEPESDELVPAYYGVNDNFDIPF